MFNLILIEKYKIFHSFYIYIINLIISYLNSSYSYLIPKYSLKLKYDLKIEIV